MGQLRLQTEMLSAKTIRIKGRPSRALEEHGLLIELIARREAERSVELIRNHIVGALEDYLRSDSSQSASPESETAEQSQMIEV